MSEQEMLGKPTEEWLKEYDNAKTIQKMKWGLGRFLEWLGKSDEEVVAEYKQATDKKMWQKVYSRKVLEYYNMRLKEGYSVNYARNEITPIRAFCRSMCMELRFKRGKIAKAVMASGEHEFSQKDLQKMYGVGNLKEKAIVVTAISLGWGSEDFLEMEQDFFRNLVERAISEKEDFIGFDYVRKKVNPDKVDLRLNFFFDRC